MDRVREFDFINESALLFIVKKKIEKNIKKVQINTGSKKF